MPVTEVVTLKHVLNGERKRLKGSIERLKHHIEALEDTIEFGGWTASTRQAITTTAAQVSNHAAAVDALAFIGTERKAK